MQLRRAADLRSRLRFLHGLGACTPTPSRTPIPVHARHARQCTTSRPGLHACHRGCSGTAAALGPHRLTSSPSPLRPPLGAHTWKPTGGVGPLPTTMSLYLRPLGSDTSGTLSSLALHSASQMTLTSCGGRLAAIAPGCELRGQVPDAETWERAWVVGLCVEPAGCRSMASVRCRTRYTACTNHVRPSTPGSGLECTSFHLAAVAQVRNASAGARAYTAAHLCAIR